MVVTKFLIMLLSVPLQIPQDNLDYAKIFKVYQDRIMELHSAEFKQEALAGKSNSLHEIAIYHSACFYCYLLHLLSNNPLAPTQDLDYWKLETGFIALQSCYLDHGIDLDTILTSLNNP